MCITTFALRAKRAHLEGLCCAQCISHEGRSNKIGRKELKLTETAGQGNK